MRRIFWTVALSLCLAGTSLAQGSCPAIIQDALSAIANNCGNLERNSACYGFDRVNADFSIDHPAGYFTQETDQAALTDLTTLQTSPLDEAAKEFGAAVMNLQANVPDSIPGQGVIFLLVGDTKIENAVTAAEAATPAKAVAVKTASAATIYRLPSTTAATLVAATAGQTLNVDGTNTNGEWVRVIIKEQVGWIARSALEASAVLETLPDVGSTTHTPMQAFYFTTGIGQSGCNQADSTITVQSPENIQVDLSMNGVDIRVGSLVTFQGNSLTVHRGQVDTSTGDSIDANETLTFPGRDDQGNFTGKGEKKDITDDEFARGEAVQGVINDVAEANGWPTREITPRGASSTCTDYVVQAGDTLFRIATRLKASMKDIIDANTLASPYTLFVGQTLCVPNAGSGFVGITIPGTGPKPPTTPDTTPPPNNGVDIPGATIVGPNITGRYVGGAVTLPADGRVRDVFQLYGIGYTSQLGGIGTYDCSRVVLYRVESDARAAKQPFTCSNGAVTTTSVGTGDYLIIEFASAEAAAQSPQSFSLLTGQ